MIQRQITHAAGMFSACATCRKEPHHYTARGCTSHEDPAFSVVAERHQLECLCERRTGWCSTLAEAIRMWGELGETLPPPVEATGQGNVHPIRMHRVTEGVSGNGDAADKSITKRKRRVERDDSKGSDV